MKTHPQVSSIPATNRKNLTLGIGFRNNCIVVSSHGTMYQKDGISIIPTKVIIS